MITAWWILPGGCPGWTRGSTPPRLTDTAPTAVIDLVGELGRQVLDHLLPQRRSRTNPRVVKRAISVYAANTARGRIRAPSRSTAITIDVLSASP